ncbi:hypothetical protein NJC40_03545 [Pseudomonas sp. 21LCFQ02]|uniref:hypothetical protein n=1 Tax=Pseudomonas sp. 21LCFQ02 TaxID=2957505 RepID=UPI00209AF4E0|nr:hypothetical protein [Pseudomonas sp. 21LCFQ02]MCO8166852.1 hypothetical protein [Pseudomonas sp. 21LCFQ02]
MESPEITENDIGMMRDMLRFMESMSKMPVGKFLDHLYPKRHEDSEAAKFSDQFLALMQSEHGEALFRMDTPVTESSTIYGMTDQGLTFYSLTLNSLRAGARFSL